MNKQECISYCVNALKVMWEKHGKPTEYLKRRETYLHCKEVCAENGYVKGAFTEIWHEATKRMIFEK